MSVIWFSRGLVALVFGVVRLDSEIAAALFALVTAAGHASVLA